MSYSIVKITSVADCDLLLAWAAKEKADLNFKKLSEETSIIIQISRVIIAQKIS